MRSLNLMTLDVCICIQGGSYVYVSDPPPPSKATDICSRINKISKKNSLAPSLHMHLNYVEQGK